MRKVSWVGVVGVVGVGGVMIAGVMIWTEDRPCPIDTANPSAHPDPRRRAAGCRCPPSRLQPSATNSDKDRDGMRQLLVSVLERRKKT